MKAKLITSIAGKLGLMEQQVSNTLALFEEGATIPFISRYRKERTGSLDEIQILDIQKEFSRLSDLESRRSSILEILEEQGNLTPELQKQLSEAKTVAELEDLYLPYKKKRKTRGVLARERGLEPLAKILMTQQEMNPEQRAKQFISEDVPTLENALQGARDIIAEWINENTRVRRSLRYMFENQSTISSKLIKGKEEEGQKYLDYFDFDEPVRRCPSHRFLAILRGEREGILRVKVQPDPEEAVDSISRYFIKAENQSSDQVSQALTDSYKRLLTPSLENETRNIYKEKADDSAINVFAQNLEQLLLMPPLGEKRILGIDPGFRSGCKLVCLDAQGQLLHNETIYPHHPQKEVKQSARKIQSMVETYKIDALAIGNGTASRETEQFIRNNIRFTKDVQVFVVNESGASIYSASVVAREEFPSYDVTVRGTVSIGRRLMDPLAELVKIDPKSIGVGQYQHDVDQKKLQESLVRVVESAVNRVGVHVNTASKHLLTHVSGLGPQLADNLVKYIKENGPFTSRNDFLKVARLGNKAFEQAAGFLRITGASNPLDNTAVHPESYPVVEKMARDLGVGLGDLVTKPELHQQINLQNYISGKVGLPTLKDIISELEKPGRDPRGKIKIFEFDPKIRTIEDLREGIILPGIVSNITNFGAFVDIGIKQDGLIHISQMGEKYIKHPGEVLSLNQQLMVKVISIDIPRKRIQLSLKGMEN